MRLINSKRNHYALVVFVAIGNLLLNVVYEVIEVVPLDSETISLFGHNEHGLVGVPGRLLDLFSYFTIWSTIVTAITFLILFKGAESQQAKLRILLPTSVLMETVTSLLFYLLIFPVSPPKGANVVPSLISHAIIPALTLYVWLRVGPRGIFAFKNFALYFLIPIIWVALTLVRGLIDGEYPYGVLDVVSIGYMWFFITVVFIIIFGTLLLFLFTAIDKRLARKFINKS